MFPDLPHELRHLIPVPMTAGLIQELDIMGRLRLCRLRICQSVSQSVKFGFGVWDLVCERPDKERAPRTLIFETVGFRLI
jgi:hypothetical protein